MKIKLFTVPNLFTLANLLCGCVAIVFILQYGNLKMAFWFIVLAAILDFLDGFMARLLKAYSEIGKQLDSLCDMVSFGVAPAMVLYYLYIAEGGLNWWAFGVYVTFIVALFAALRLAKFNIDESQSDQFVGLPTPAATLFVVAAGYLYAEQLFSIEPYWILVVGIVLAWLMISPIRMFAFKFKSFAFKGNELRYTFILLALISLIIFKITAIPFIIVGYILISTTIHVAQLIKGAKQ